jgi:hypothetical protein
MRFYYDQQISPRQGSPLTPGGSSVGAFSNPSIQNADFGDWEEEGPERGAFRQITALQVLRSINKELADQLIEVVSDQNNTVFVDDIDES